MLKDQHFKKKQFQNEKAGAIFSSIINTATAVVKALPNIPLSITVGLLGAAQTALIASQPIPKFKTGVRDFSGGLAILGDGGVSEFARTPDGKVFKTPNKDTLYNLPKGTDVFKNEAAFMMDLKRLTDMNNIMFDTNLINTPMMPEIIINNDSISKEEYNKGVNKIVSTIKSNRGGSIVFDERGYTKYLKNKAGRTEKLNNIVRIKRRSV